VQTQHFSPANQSVHNLSYRDHLIQSHAEILNLVKWKDLGLSESEELYRRGVMAQIIETVLENSQSGALSSGMVMESAGTSTANLQGYAQTILPLLLNVFPNLIGHELFSIQPMNGPLGQVYYYDWVYASNKGSVNAGTKVMGSGQTYAHQYSSEEIDGESLGAGDGTKWGGAGSAINYSTAYMPIYPNNNTDNSNPSPVRQVSMVELNSAGAAVQTAVDNGIGGFTGDAASGSIDYATGAITGFKFTAAVGNGNIVKVFYWYKSEGNSNIGDISFETRAADIRAEDRELRATWTMNATEDLRRQHGIDGHATMIAGISSLIGYDLDRMMIDRTRRAAATSATWDQAGASAGESQIDYYATLVTTMHQVGATILTKTQRSRPQWAVTSPNVAAILEQLQKHGDYAPAAPTTERAGSFGGISSDLGVSRVGLISNRLRLYQDPHFPASQILLGFKGSNYLESGAVYAPYIALSMTPAFHDPNDGKMKRRFTSRDAFKVIRPEYYGLVNISNLNAPV